MKHLHQFKVPLVLAAAFLASCSSGKGASASGNSTVTTSISSVSISVASYTVSSDFSIATSDGAFSVTNNVYTISSAGTYTLSGKLDGMIYVEASEEDEVELDLNNVSISNSSNSPLFVYQASEVKIKALKGTSNFITDQRALQTSEDTSQGAGAIYAKADLKLVGSGSLTVTGTYNNGVHTSKDLTIKNQNLTVTAPNNAIKGNDSITVTSGTINAISTSGDALKTTSTDLSSKSKQRGSVSITGGTLNLFAGCDGIDASYNIEVSNGTDEDDPSVVTVPSIIIHTNKYSSYSDSSVLSNGVDTLTDATKVYAWGDGGRPGGPGSGMVPGGDAFNADKAEDSAKGLKAANGIYVSGGTLAVQAYDDALHANSGDSFESGGTGVGLIEVSGGEMTIACSDDALHADGALNIKGGTITVAESHEALEGKTINISGGETTAYGSDDGVNASSAINVSGGYLFACVPSSGDTDGIDSNGSYKQTGGTVITCGPNSMNMAALDTDGSASVNGGTFVAFGYAGNISSSLTKSTKSGSYSNKAYTLTFSNDSVVTKKLTSSYSSLVAYSELGSLTSIA